jgi:SAM-dependent methyltransferase
LTIFILTGFPVEISIVEVQYIILYSGVTMTASQPSYDEKFFEPLHAIEEKHFWFRSRNQLIGGLIEKYCSPTLSKTLLGMEIGCGTGNVLKYLNGRFSGQCILGMDLFREGLVFAALRGNSCLIQADIHHSPFKQEFDWIGLFDIIEHLDDDVLVLQDTAALLREDGKLLISVPAFPVLWSYFDVAGKHKRRYTTRSLQEACQKAGLELIFSSYTNALIFPILWVVRRVFQLGKAPESLTDEVLTEKTNSELRIIPLVNSLMTLMLGLEASLIQAGVRMPFGTSLIAVVHRKS